MFCLCYTAEHWPRCTYDKICYDMSLMLILTTTEKEREGEAVVILLVKNCPALSWPVWLVKAHSALENDRIRILCPFFGLGVLQYSFIVFALAMGLAKETSTQNR